jgi:hypothetical protein
MLSWLIVGIVLIATNGLIDFVTMDWHFLGGLDAQSHFVAANLNNDNSDVVIDDNALVFLSGQYQHESIPSQKEALTRPHTGFAYLSKSQLQRGGKKQT